MIAKTGPAGRERAKSLLRAAGKLADYAIGLGLEPLPEIVLHPSTAERFTRCAPGLSGVARRPLRSNLRFIGRRVVPQFYPEVIDASGVAARIEAMLPARVPDENGPAVSELARRAALWACRHDPSAPSPPY